jgi:hypothetical protein
MTADQTQPTESDLLRMLLAGRDIACPVCAYNLRGNQSDHCPECGAALDLRVASTDLKLGPWLTAVLGVALPLGFVAIYGAFLVIMFISFALDSSVGGSEMTEVLVTAAIPTVICGAYALVLWRIIRRRRKFWARPRRVQWRIALLYATLAPGALVAVPILLVFLFELF